MRLTKKGEYGLKSLLALARHYDKKTTITLREIAETEKMPLKFLEQIMMVLKKANLIQSTKGKHGGYRLARSAREITLGEIIRIIDGPLSPFESGAELEKKIKNHVRHVGLYAILLDVRNAIASILDKKTLADVLEKSQELSWTEAGEKMYYI